MKKKVVIIGAGPAGLSAAYELLQKSEDYEVVILEESNQIGGISRTVKFNGNRMDIGGHRFFTKNERVKKFWYDVMPLQSGPALDDKILGSNKVYNENGNDPEKDDNVMLIRRRVSRIYYLKKFFDYPISLSFKTIKNMGFVRTIKSGFSYIKSCILKKKEDSLENFYINRFGKKLYSMFFEKYTEKLWGRHPSQISADWGAQRVKGVSIVAVLKDAFKKIFHIKKRNVETSLIEEFNYPKYGPGQLWERVACLVEQKGCLILKGYKVCGINVDKNTIKSVDCLVGNKKETIYGDIFLSSMPLKDLVNAMGDNVCSKIIDIANNLPYRDFVTVGLLLKEINLKNETEIKTLNNIIPDCWIYVQEEKVKLGRIQIFNNWSPYMVKNPLNTVWIGLEYFCDEGDSFWNMTNKECIDYVINELVLMGIINKNNVIMSHREKVKKAYPAYFDSYKDIDKIIEYVNSIDNLYCIGRNGQHRYNNMDHSVLTGFVAVDSILGYAKKEDVWKVNTEKDYHESTN